MRKPMKIKAIPILIFLAGNLVSYHIGSGLCVVGDLTHESRYEEPKFNLSTKVC